MKREPREEKQEREEAGRSNRLMREKSPYLLQHAHNPVDWYAWGEEAFAKAKREDKPIFLSIGYSTCHWCHVMEKESFEDEEVARILNEVFVCIKVDREERPDIDAVYMTACQAMTGSGGWPLTIFMTPEKKPFFAGTYIPKLSGWGRVGLMTLTEAIREVWKSRRAEVLESAEKITGALRETKAGEGTGGVEEGASRLAYERLAESFDANHGGFGGAPKFPRPHGLMFLLRWWKRSGQEKALRMVERTLEMMRCGGICDQVGFGFHRYSTDEQWLVPHFEKMLYDQALMTLAYVEAYEATGKGEYERDAREVIEYVLRDMRSPEGGFRSGEDADSEGEEGKFYVWTAQEIREALGEEAGRFGSLFGVKENGNWTEEARGGETGTNILHLDRPMEGRAREWVESARKKLLRAREKRVRPGKDDKILTDWNGLMIAALARAGRAFDESAYVKAAERAAGFIMERMRREDGRLLHSYRDGESAVMGCVEDYAFVIWGLIELYEADFDVRHLERATVLAEDMVKHFWDVKEGGFFQTADDAEELLLRRKEAYDAAVPSGNSVAAMDLARLARMTGRMGLEEKAEQTVKASAAMVNGMPTECTQLLQAVEYLAGPTYEIVIAGKREAQDTKAMLKALRGRFLPNAVVVLKDEGEAGIERVAPITAGQRSIEGKATAYVCQNRTCKAPTTNVEDMLKAAGVRE